MSKSQKNLFKRKSTKNGVFFLGCITLIYLILTNLFAQSVTFPDIQNGHTKHHINNVEKGKLAINYIDVGQGESILIQTPNNKTMLIDAGGTKADASYNYLNKKGVSKIDCMIITHPHSDHISEIPKIINKFEVGQIYMPKIIHTSKTFENLLDAISKKGIKVLEAKAGVNINLDKDLICNILAPNSNKYGNLNNWSSVLRIDYKQNSFLFMGDAEEISEKEILMKDFNIKADVLKIGHHGSSSSTSLNFLNKVNPTYAVISAGKDNKYGHPHKDILNILKQKGVKTYVTADVGNIVLISDGEKIYFK